MSESTVSAIEAAGYPVTRGTFGTPTEVEPSDAYAQVPCNHRLPDFPEQEVLFVDFAAPAPLKGSARAAPEGVDAWYQNCRDGNLDPRPLLMEIYSKDLARIMEHGGALIVLASDKRLATYRFGNRRSTHETLVDLSAWSLLSHLVDMEVQSEYGSEIHFDKGPLGQLLKGGAEGARYSCAFSPQADFGDDWRPLARNKYGSIVAGLLIFRHQPIRPILFLPQMPKLHLVVKELLERFLADWNPALFPHLEGRSWLHRREYELPTVTALSDQIAHVTNEANKHVKALSAQIQQLRSSNPHWYQLLIGTDAALVAAVVDALRKCGFKQIVDVDKEAAANGESGQLREDIQVHDRSPTLVIDVKGVRGRPSDPESTQADKHATMRMRQWKRTDVQPLTIINSERHLPPDRRDRVAYRDEIVGNAVHSGLGLMTTWDIFRILRDASRLNWPLDAVQDIFYQTGRIDIVPSHYRSLGTIVKLWREAIGIVPTQPLAIGDVLAVEVGESFEHVSVKTLQVGSAPRTNTGPQEDVGVGVSGASIAFSKGCRVFKVMR
jgi:hypothetical protein